jgi:hypothetical protein
MRRLSFFLACAIASSIACGADTGDRPVPTLSTSAEAGRAFSILRDAYEKDPHDAALAKRFADFVVRYPSDRISQLAHLYLGHIFLDLKDVPAARHELAATVEPPPGNAHDFWLALNARLARVDGHYEDAVATLQPLVGTVVDTALRTSLLEEVAVASIDAHRSLEAVAYLDGWLRSVPPHAHKVAHERVQELLGRVAPSVLEETLEAMQGEGSGGYAPELQKLVAESLAKHAIDSQDTHLAQRLIASSLGKYLTGSAVGQDLRDLATSLRGSRAVAFRTIGLVLPTDTPELRDAAAEAARGAAFALGLPRAQGDDDGTKLVTRADASASLDASLEELAGAGAAIVLAGFDEASAERACAWAEQNQLTVITFAAPKNAGTRFCFVAGEARTTSIALLVAELEKRAGKQHPKVATIAGAIAEPAFAHTTSSVLELQPPFRCEPPYSRSRLPVADWTQHGVRDFLLSAPSGCARTVLSALPRGANVGLAIESTSSEDEEHVTLGLHAFAVAPVASPQVDEYKQRFGAKPSYWTALGRDGALLAHVAEASLPNDRTVVASEIAKRREVARTALLVATTTLWTTDSTGFANLHKLARTLRIVDLP